jgi:uncharacterized membrane protein YbhN (UPF0104 family)
MLRLLLILPGIAGSLVFTYLAVRNVDGRVFWETIRTSEYGWVLPAVLVLTVAIFLRALRWRLLFPPPTRPPLAPITLAMLVGNLFGNIIPIRAGEAARVVVLHRETGGSRAEAAGTLVAERLYDVLSLLVLLFAATPFLPAVDWLRGAAILGAAVAVIAAGLALAAGENPSFLRVVLRPLAAHSPAIPRRAERGGELDRARPRGAVRSKARAACGGADARLVAGDGRVLLAADVRLPPRPRLHGGTPSRHRRQLRRDHSKTWSGGERFLSSHTTLDASMSRP